MYTNRYIHINIQMYIVYKHYKIYSILDPELPRLQAVDWERLSSERETTAAALSAGAGRATVSQTGGFCPREFLWAPRISMYICIHTYIHTYIRTCMYIYVYIYIWCRVAVSIAPPQWYGPPPTLNPKP